jgi:lipopolysaccharide assembly LptE-like protein
MEQPHRRPFPAALLLAAVAWLMTGCGYSASDPAVGQSGAVGGLGGYQWKSLYREDVRTVAVPIFSNRSFRRGVEFQLTKAIVNQIEAQTPYKVVPRDRADTILEGEITDIFIHTYSADPNTGVPQDQFYYVRVNFTWKDLRTGKILADRRRFEQTATYYPTLGEGRFIGSQENVERLALAIVQEMQADW